MNQSKVFCMWLSLGIVVIMGNYNTLVRLDRLKKSHDGPSIVWEVREVEMRAYCPGTECCGEDANGITASGHIIQPGDKFLAAPESMFFGKIVFIPEYCKEPVAVEDRGAHITEDRMEVFFPTHEEALEWGVKKVKVYTLHGTD